MITGKICILAIICYIIISSIILMVLEEEYEYNFSKLLWYSFCWPLFIILLPIFFIIRVIKLIVKLKEANETKKIEEYRRKKETVYTVLKELKIR